jgi:replicative DNA helicase
MEDLNKRPMLSDFENLGSEQDADLVINLYIVMNITALETPDRGVAEIIIAKHRNGPVGFDQITH